MLSIIKKKKLNPINGFDYTMYKLVNNDLAAYSDSEIDNYLEKQGFDEIKKGKRNFHKDFEPFNEEIYLEKFADLKGAIEAGTLESAFYHFKRFGYQEIITGQREWPKKEDTLTKDVLENEYLIEDVLRKSVYLQFLSGLDRVKYLEANTDLLLAIENRTIENIDSHFQYKGLEEVYIGNRILMQHLDPYDETTYLELNQDLKEEINNKRFMSGFEHFLLFGYKEVLSGLRLMKHKEAIEIQRPDSHSLNKMIIEQSGFFDTEFYTTHYADIKDNDIEPLTHYLMFGAQERRDPSNIFSTNYYLNENPDVLNSGINPLVHYILVGESEKRKTIGHDPKKEVVEFFNLPIIKKPSEKIDLKIAIIIHAFYIDVLEDIISSIDRVSPKPDLFVSVAEDANIEEIELFLKDKGYMNFTIKAVQNRGRDVAPFLIEFAESLKSYDVCCKIHGKKSLYAGSEQTNWRNHLYHNLLGSKEIVDDILSAFSENKKLGLLFSDNYGMIPYWGYTWLTNKGAVNRLLHKFNLQHLAPIMDQTYIDYPAGTMFWFRPEAISQILDSSLKYDDFPEEPIGNDGTIAHGLERLFGYVTRLNGYDYIELNQKLKQYTKNVTHKNFNQHQAKTLETAKSIVVQKECIIFDIFDTLVTRTIFYPDNLFRIMEQQFDKEFSIISNFMKVRKETEYALRVSDTHIGDVSYNDIYDHIHLHSDYTPKMIEYLRTMDFNYELEILVPKPDAIKLLKYAYDNNIDTLFVSDMYLTKAQVMAILEKQDIPYKEENVLVSSNTGYRKDNTTVWKHLVDSKRIDPAQTLMIGDSEVSDAKLPGDFGIETFHVFSERNAFFESPFGKSFSERFGQISEKEMLLMGPVVNHIFSSAFELSDTVLGFSKKCNPYTFGYTALAPFFYLFVNNIYQKLSDKSLYFLARDGYFIQKTFDHFLETKKLELKGETHYLEISRRAMLGAVLKNEKNLKNMILDLGTYEGLFSNMIYNRVGLDASFLSESGIEDFEIHNDEDLDKAYSLLLEHIDLINEHAKSENKAYIHYLESINFFNKDNEDILIDLGYSGTIQNYLHQLTQKKLLGEYFVTTEKVLNIEDDNNQLNGYFADKIDPSDNCNIVYKYALILEAFLTSDKGQLICFTEESDKLIPQYKETNRSLEVQNNIMEGIKDYISALSIVPADFLDTDNERIKAIALFTYEYMIHNRLLDKELMRIFHLEDEFTGSQSLDIMSILTERGI